MIKAFKTLSIKHKILFQIFAPIFTIVATLCFNFREYDNGSTRFLDFGFGTFSIRVLWIITLIIAIVSYVMFYIGSKNTSDENEILKNSIKEKDRTILEISDKHLQLENEYEGLRGNYNLFFDKILSLIYVHLGLGGRDRISVYFIPKDEEIFILQSRFSKNQDLRKKSDRNYPFKEGFIYKAIEENGLTENIHSVPEDDFKAYIKEVRSKCSISEDRISNMNMKSRSYHIKNINNDDHETVGLIVLESLDCNKFDDIDKNDTFNNYSTIIKEFISKHRNSFFSKLASIKGF